MSLDNKSRYFLHSSRIHYLFNKANLIDLFTISVLPTIKFLYEAFIPKRTIGEIIPYNDFYANYDVTGIEEIVYPTLYVNCSDTEYKKMKNNFYFNFTTVEIEDKNIPYICKDKAGIIPAYNEIKLNTIYNVVFISTNEVISMTSIKSENGIFTFKRAKDFKQYKGYTLFTDTYYVYADCPEKNGYIVLCEYGNIPFKLYEKFTIEQGDIESFISPNPEVTSYGRVLANYFLISSIFGDRIPYKNKEFEFGDIEKDIADLILNKKATVQEGQRYLDHALFLGSFGEMCVPGLSKKSIQTDPKVIERKKELLEKYKDQLDDPVIISKIEDELLAMDKEWLKDDDSYGFYGSEGKKFHTHRKKQFIMAGVSEDFTKEKGKYSFVENSLSDGWDLNSFDSIVNEIRKGSYERGISTAKGGVQSKNILRLLQNVTLTSDDCGTKRTLDFVLTEKNAPLYYGTYLVDNGKLVNLSKDNASQYIGKLVHKRSFMYCEEKDGYCRTCAGQNYSTLDQDAVGVLALELTSVFTKLSLKAMHGKKLSTIDIKNLDDYVV